MGKQCKTVCVTDGGTQTTAIDFAWQNSEVMVSPPPRGKGDCKRSGISGGYPKVMYHMPLIALCCDRTPNAAATAASGVRLSGTRVLPIPRRCQWPVCGGRSWRWLLGGLDDSERTDAVHPPTSAQWKSESLVSTTNSLNPLPPPHPRVTSAHMEAGSHCMQLIPTESECREKECVAHGANS